MSLTTILIQSGAIGFGAEQASNQYFEAAKKGCLGKSAPFLEPPEKAAQLIGVSAFSVNAVTSLIFSGFKNYFNFKVPTFLPPIIKFNVGILVTPFILSKSLQNSINWGKEVKKEAKSHKANLFPLHKNGNWGKDF
ncbi:MAG: hypothetical protein WDZ28_04300 [Simkaniaceae bacterium]